MGDDLNFAQRFSAQSCADLAQLLTEPAEIVTAQSNSIAALMTDVQSGAKRLRARAIYRGAQTVLDSMQNAAQPQIVQGRILALNKLVSQYSDGVQELDRLLENETPEATSKAKTPPTEMADNPFETLTPEAASMRLPTEEDLFDQQASERGHLGDLLHLAGSEERANLEALLAFRPEPPRSSAVPITDKTDIPLEPVLRDAIQDALATARQLSKTISISYDGEDARITPDRARMLEQDLAATLRVLVIQSLPAEGLGHLDLRVEGDVLNVSCLGTAPMSVPDFALMRQTADHITLSLALRADVKRTPAPKIEDAAPQPLITEKTEQGLRAQLAALMDPEAAIQQTPSAEPQIGSVVHTLFAEDADLAANIDTAAIGGSS